MTAWNVIWILSTSITLWFIQFINRDVKTDKFSHAQMIKCQNECEIAPIQTIFFLQKWYQSYQFARLWSYLEALLSPPRHNFSRLELKSEQFLLFFNENIANLHTQLSFDALRMKRLCVHIESVLNNSTELGHFHNTDLNITLIAIVTPKCNDIQ